MTFGIYLCSTVLRVDTCNCTGFATDKSSQMVEKVGGEIQLNLSFEAKLYLTKEKLDIKLIQ